MSTRKKILASIAIIALLLATTGVFILRNQSKLGNNTNEVAGTQVSQNDQKSTESSSNLEIPDETFPNPEKTPSLPQGQNITPPDPLTNYLTNYIEELTIEQKVGIMFMGGVYKQDMLTAQLSLISKKNFGGILLMGVNVSTPSKRVQTMEQISLVNTKTYPLLIAIDEEGGKVSRLWDQLDEQTSQPNTKNTTQAYNIAYNRGHELTEMGINVNFSPVIDTIQNEDSFLFDRAFQTHPQNVAELGISMINGYSDAGIVAVPKHYPGHPDTKTDSHKDLPESTIQIEQLNDYAEAFRLTIFNAEPEMLMTGHINFPNIDPIFPATLSPILIHEKLRAEYGYDGVIITDDMNMGAIRESFGTAEAAVQAIRAGNDILLYVTTPDIQLFAYNAVVDAIKNGTLNEERINESVYRILKLRESL